MEDNKVPVKALRIDIKKILENTPGATSVNIFYKVITDEIDVIGMEITSGEEPVKQETIQ